MKYTRIMTALLLPLAAQAAPQETAPATQSQTIAAQDTAGSAGTLELRANAQPAQGELRVEGGSASPAVVQSGKPIPANGVLAIGSPAPAVKFGEFFKGDEIRALDPEKTYIIEFWAINCAPCVAAMPHMTELAKKAGDSVVVVGVNAWNDPAESIKTFLGKQGGKVGYRIASDPDGFMMKNWMEAAGARGIPSAFVVVKGTVLWIGHPGELDLETLTGLRDGRLTVEAMRRRHDDNLACAAEFGIPLVETKGDAEVVLAKLKELATRYPDATFPAHMRGHFENMLKKVPDGEATHKSGKQQADFAGRVQTATARIDVNTPEGQEAMKVIVHETNVNTGHSREATLKWQDGRKVLRVVENSKLLFDGPVDTEDEQAKIPENVQKQFSRMWILGKNAKKPGEALTPSEKQEFNKAREEYDKAAR